MSYCERYIKELGKQLAPLTINNGGNIIMVQVENEYGSYAADKEYLVCPILMHGKSKAYPCSRFRRRISVPTKGSSWYSPSRRDSSGAP